MLSRCFLDFSVGVWAFVIGLGQISSFLSYIFTTYTVRQKCKQHKYFAFIKMCGVFVGEQEKGNKKDSRNQQEVGLTG